MERGGVAGASGTGSGTVDEATAPVVVEHAGRAGPFVILVDHASNFVPEVYGGLGLGEADLARHIAWDPGALPVARLMAEALDAPLVRATRSRLLIDLNRDPAAPDSICTLSETTAIPGNRDLSDLERARRVRDIYDPYHAAVDDLVAGRLAAGLPTALVALHSFNPVYRGVARPWPVGILFDEDRRLADPLVADLRSQGFLVGENEPYGPWDRVYHTLERHGRSRGLPVVMIELRNDGIADPEGQQAWAARLAGSLGRLAAVVGGRNEREQPARTRAP
jgi:predicted N-formylglutamate amidohydrolase